VTRSVRFRAEAEAEAVEAQRWYESRRSGLGIGFAGALEHSLSRIAKNPAAFPKVRGETRRAVLQRFPYAIYFRVSDDAVVVLAVHGRQHPERWHTRV
jgi:plasmid stabilization system protein ParE